MLRRMRDAAARGQGLVELGLILGIAALVAALALVVFGPQLAAILDLIGTQVDAAGGP
jgi:hypothetical protein